MKKILAEAGAALWQLVDESGALIAIWLFGCMAVGLILCHLFDVLFRAVPSEIWNDLTTWGVCAIFALVALFLGYIAAEDFRQWRRSVSRFSDIFYLLLLVGVPVALIAPPAYQFYYVRVTDFVWVLQSDILFYCLALAAHQLVRRRLCWV